MTIDIPFPTEVEVFCGNSRVSQINSQKVYIPLESNFPAIDVVYPPHLIQITSAKEQGVNTKGLTLVRNIFPQQKLWNFIFVMPDAKVETFKAKSGKKYSVKKKISFYSLR